MPPNRETFASPPAEGPGPVSNERAASSLHVADGRADPAEIDRLFREHNDALLRFIAAKLGSSQEAREIAQEAYVRVLSLDHHKAVSYLRAFLFKTAANLAMDRLRQRARRGFMVYSQSLDFAVFELSPERQLDGEQAVKRLRAGLAELPQKCRDAFLLTRLEGLSCEEVAERLNVEPRSVWRYVARALEYLRERIKDDGPSEGKEFGP